MYLGLARQLANRRTRYGASPSILSTRVSLAQHGGPASPSAPVSAWHSSRVRVSLSIRISLAQLAGPRLPQHWSAWHSLWARVSLSTCPPSSACSFSSSKLLCIHDPVSSRLLQHLPISICYFDVRRGNRCVIKCKRNQHLCCLGCTLQ